MPDDAPDFEASVRLLTPAEGGRSKPVPSGLRCGWQLAEDTRSDGLLRLVGSRTIGTATVERILNPALERSD